MCGVCCAGLVLPYRPGDPQYVVGLETHANGTDWASW